MSLSIVKLAQLRATWTGCLSEELCILGWLVGMSVRDFLGLTEIGKSTLNILKATTFYGLDPTMNIKESELCTSLHTLISYSAF